MKYVIKKKKKMYIHISLSRITSYVIIVYVETYSNDLNGKNGAVERPKIVEEELKSPRGYPEEESEESENETFMKKNPPAVVVRRDDDGRDRLTMTSGFSCFTKSTTGLHLKNEKYGVPWKVSPATMNSDGTPLAAASRFSSRTTCAILASPP